MVKNSDTLKNLLKSAELFDNSQLMKTEDFEIGKLYSIINISILHLIKNLLDEYNALKITFEVFFEAEMTITKIPTKQENILKFKDFNKTIRHCVFIASDIEAFLKPISTCEPSLDSSFSHNVNTREAIAAGYYIYSEIRLLNSNYKFFFGADYIDHYLKSLIMDCKEIAENFYGIHFNKLVINCWLTAQIRQFLRL
jgi:hypothetical protein